MAWSLQHRWWSVCSFAFQNNFSWCSVRLKEYDNDRRNIFRSAKKKDDYANTYQCPSPSIQVGQVQYLQWTGFFTRRKLQEAYDTLKQYALSRNTLPWVSLDVQGFADSPISFDLKEHMFFTDGDNSYTIVFRSKGEAVIRRSLSSNNNKVKNNKLN